MKDKRFESGLAQKALREITALKAVVVLVFVTLAPDQKATIIQSIRTARPASVSDENDQARAIFENLAETLKSVS